MEGSPKPPGALTDTEASVALIFNTSDELERPFLRYIADETKKPVWGVGPLLPAQFWTISAGNSLIHDHAVDIRPNSDSNTEADVLAFLDSKPPLSVLYISFGSLNTPSEAEMDELAAALELSSCRPFIWAVQPAAIQHDAAGFPVEPGAEPYYPARLASRAGDRGMVIRGWAPQLLILSHRATGGFLTHCGWNSTLEALACGVPMLTWPLHGDQVHNAKLVTRRLRVGVAVRSSEDGAVPVTREEVARGIEWIMTDDEMRKRATEARQMFAGGFPASSSASLDELINFVSKEM